MSAVKRVAQKMLCWQDTGQEVGLESLWTYEEPSEANR
jgi:hypothetical protein